jgi:hypothetical protein
MTIVAITVAIVMVVVMVVPGVIPIGTIPTPVVTVPVVRTIPIVVIIPPRAVITVVVWIVVRVIIGIMVWVETPVPCIAYIDVSGIAIVVASIVVIVVVHGGACTCTETLDAGGKVLVIIGFGGGVNHAVGVGHRFSGLIHGIDVGLVVLAVGVIRLIVVGSIAADTGS